MSGSRLYEAHADFRAGESPHGHGKRPYCAAEFLCCWALGSLFPSASRWKVLQELGASVAARAPVWTTSGVSGLWPPLSPAMTPDLASEHRAGREDGEEGREAWTEGRLPKAGTGGSPFSALLPLFHAVELWKLASCSALTPCSRIYSQPGSMAA